jgi:hypothetical protein
MSSNLRLLRKKSLIWGFSLTSPQEQNDYTLERKSFLNMCRKSADFKEDPYNFPK